MNELYIVIVILVLIGFFLFDYTRPFSKGYRGELIVDRNLQRSLNDEYTIFHDLTFKLQSGRTTQIDHIIVSKYGVFIIETKNMTGWIFGNENQKKWTQVIYENKRSFQNPLHQNFYHVKALSSILKMNEKFIQSAVIFVGDSQFQTEMPDNVFDNTLEFNNYIKSFNQVFFTDETVVQVCNAIEEEALSDEDINKQHIHNIKNRNVFNKTTCKKCGSSMVERTNNYTNEKFLGCSNYPKCKNTEKM